MRDLKIHVAQGSAIFSDGKAERTLHSGEWIEIKSGAIYGFSFLEDTIFLEIQLDPIERK